MAEENKIVRYETKIQLAPSSMTPVNKQFALVDILLCYHGRNRNMTSMSKEVIEKALPSLYGIPIVGEYIYLDDGSQDFGTHGGKVVIDDSGIKFEQTTKPYGFITKEAVDNASWVTIKEKNGVDTHEYLKLEKCVLWLSRYEEVKKLLDKNYGESMEIEINSYEYDDDNYCVIKDFTFSAACILGSHTDGTKVEPCFESSKIGRLFELDTFKQEFSHMLDEYKEYENTLKGENLMDLTKFTEILSTVTFKNNADEDVVKYRLLSATDSKVFALDMEDYKPYGFDYAITTVEDNEETVIDFESKVEMSLSATDKISDENFKEFDIISEIEIAAEAKSDEKTAKNVALLEAEFNKKIEELKSAYNELSESYSIAIKKLDDYTAKERADAKAKHNAEIEALFDTYSEKLGKCSEFLIYKAKVDPDNVTVDEVKERLTLMVGKYMMETQTKKNFAYTPSESGVAGIKNNIESKYGHLLDKYI